MSSETERIKAIVLVVAMIGVIVLTSVAMMTGHDGQTYAGGIGALVTIAAYLFTQTRKPEKEEKEEAELIEE